jgi:hypothetical protein
VLTMPADISIPRLAVIALVALVISIIGRSCQAAARPRGQAGFGIVCPFFGLRCSPDRSPGASGHRPTDSFIHWHKEAMRLFAVFAPSCGAAAKLS